MSDARQRLDLYLRHRAALIDYATPIVGDRAQAEDVVQEAWLRFARPTSPQAEARTIFHPVGFLYRVVRNLAIDWSRRIAPELRGADGEAALAELPAHPIHPEQQAVERDQLATVARALAELPERTRRAFRLHRIEGRTYSEIAAELGVSIGTAHTLVKDAVAHCMSRILGDAE